MEKTDFTRLIKYWILGINILSIMFISILVFRTPLKICELGKAMEFLNSVDRIPLYPRLHFYGSIASCVLLLINFFLRQFIVGNKLPKIYLLIVFDAIIITVIMILTNANYNGAILWVIANLVYYDESKSRFAIIGVGIVFYMLTNFSIVSMVIPLFSIFNYINIYYGGVRSLLFFIHYSLLTANLAFFIIFCVYFIQQKQVIIDEVNALYQQLSKANEELKEYASIKEKMGETKERNRLAREIHDTLGHSLTGISVGIEACLSIIDQDKEKAKKQLEVISMVAKDGIAEVRLSVSSLQADSQENYSLTDRVLLMIEKTKQATGVTIVFNFDPNVIIEKYEENAIFRLIQEGITNAIRHGKARNIFIKIIRENELHIQVKDDGIGCDTIVPGFGIRNMKDRITFLKGSIVFSNSNGFCIDAYIPLRKGGVND